MRQCAAETYCPDGAEEQDAHSENPKIDAYGDYISRPHAAHWNGRNMFGEKVAAGIYFYTLTTDDFTTTRKMLIRK